MDFQTFWDFCAQNKTSEIPKNTLSAILGRLCAEQNARNFNKCTFRNSGILARNKQRRKSSKIEDPGFVEPLVRGVVASAGSKSSKNENVGFLKPLSRGVVASGGSKSAKIEGLGILRPLLRGVAAFGRPPLWFSLLALNKAHVLALNTAQVLRLSKADVLALNKAHVLRLNTKICPVFTANTKETTLLKAAPLSGGRRRPPPLRWLCTQGMS